MKKIMCVAVVMLLTLICCVGCSADFSEEQLKEDLTEYENGVLLAEGETIQNVVVVEDHRRENKKGEIAALTCTVITEDTQYRYEKKCYLMYEYDDDDGEWDLSGVEMSDEETWTMSPLAGVSENEIVWSMYNANFVANNENWTITDGNVILKSVDQHTTDLENGVDTVKATISIDDTLQQAVGQVTLRYEFDRGWKLVSMDGQNALTVSYKPGKELKVDEAVLLEVVDGQTGTFGVENILTQTVTVKKDELTDFSIIHTETSEYGTRTVITCEGTLTKKNVVLKVTIKAHYGYQESWNFEKVEVIPQVVSVDAVGTWNGSNVYGHTCILTITEMDAEGNIKGSYTDKGNQGKYAFSYKVSGKLDLSTFRLSLAAGDLISAKPFKSFKPYDITARLVIDEGFITGNADLKFTVAKK